VIAAAGIRTLLGKRAFLGLLVVSWIPFLVRAGQIYASANLPQAEFLAPTREMFRNVLDQQEVFLFFITVYAGSGLIASDRRANALQIYLSKPLTRAEYVAGTLAILMALILFVTWAPAILLLGVQIALSGSFAFARENLALVPAITIVAIGQAVTVSFAMLALSSLSNSSRFVGVAYAALTFFTQAIVGVLSGVTGDSRWSWISVPNDLALLGDAIFRLPTRFQTPVPVAFLVVAAVIVLSAFVLERRIRAVEIVT
jgi:ABC-2 type transport system permease protein